VAGSVAVAADNRLSRQLPGGGVLTG